MEETKVAKRTTPDDFDVKTREPVLVRLDKHGCAPRDIYIDKDMFKIGRGRDNDEIILDVMISRRHCIIRCEGNEEWIIKDTSSSTTFVNDVPLDSGASHKLCDGDIIQFSTRGEFKYLFTFREKAEHNVKRPRMDEKILDNVLIEQKTFSENQECQRKVLKDKLQTKQKEQDDLKKQLEELLRHQSATREDTEELKKQIVTLEAKIESGNIQEQHLHHMYSELLQKLENERVQFEAKLNEEKQKWQEALDLSKQEKEMLEIRMREQMEKWREEQQSEWKTVMENRVKEEKNIQAQLLNEKTLLEEKLKETEKALNERNARTDITQISASAGNSGENCIYLQLVNANDGSDFHILDTIDLTGPTQPVINTDSQDGVLNKVSDIMDEQLTCSICSELFVNATTLSCMHTFCQHCIKSWIKRQKDCPVCRAPVASMNRSIVLDNFIESMLENLPTDLKDRRKELMRERQVVRKKKKHY